MKDQLPSPDFDRGRYERPNEDWLCGHACEGRPCRLGPDAKGNCCSTAECRPTLVLQPGETKGLWKCTRPREHGGPCAEGPAPDGACGCPIIPCSPQRSLRNLRGRITWATLALALAFLLVAVAGPWRWQFVSPGRLSVAHRGAGFDRLSRERFGQPGCAGCHQAAEAGVGQWLLVAFNSDPGLLQFSRLARATTREETRMDRQNCVPCHRGYERHQPDVVHAHSCSSCHLEHQGTRMRLPTDEGCAHCHADAATLASFAARGGKIPSSHFDPPLPAGTVSFQSPRPPAGRVSAFRSFAEGHPEFAVRASGTRDPDTLRFPHALHLGSTVSLGGKALACADCHQPDTAGAFMKWPSFEANCRACHALQFDPSNPELTLPHGSVEAVRGIVRSLPLLYTDLARRKGIVQADAAAEWSRQAQAKIRRTLGGGDQLLELALFTPDPRTVDPKLSSDRRAQLAGCAYCHEVKRDGHHLATVTPPVIPDRWMTGGRFDHSKHVQQSCVECHASAAASASAADINLPSKASCVRCHSPAGGAPAGCATCHSYHLFKSQPSMAAKP
ncbi:MAG: hypothetical protein DVB31_16885 [Verrucomicrobia bacterium]|nr:MAG: hypothetical protein DVB31_16885 [Verrucomicrobiota bacterium]